VLLAFLAFCRRQDWPVALYQASGGIHDLCQEGGLHTFKIGEEALIDIMRFTLQGKAGAPVRHAVARARRAEISVQCWQGEALPEEIFTGMRRISAAWLDERKVQVQLGFSMGRFPADWSEDLLTVVAFDASADVIAFLTWTPLYMGDGWALDAIRRVNKTPPGTMELLIAHAIEWAQTHGYTRMSLGLAPLQGLEREELESAYNAATGKRRTTWLTPFERSATFLHQRGILLGSYRSINAFKAKFQPTWEARYLIVSEGSALPRILLALAQAHDCGWGSLFHRVKTMGKSVARLLYAG
jgi:phosphatidylglycerol lysyltransferase